MPGLVLWLLLASIPACAIAGNEDNAHYDRIHLSASAVAEVPNDVVEATLYYELEGSNQSSLADKVNQHISSAIKLVKKYPEVKIQTLGYNTQPIYKQQNIVGWRVRQSFHLESENVATMSNLLGQLQSQISLQAIGNKVSTSTLDTAREKLTIDAIAEFKRKATIIASQFDRPGYRLVEIIVDAGSAPPRTYRAAPGVMTMEARAVAPPSVEGGTQTITVTVSGSIELQRP